MAETTVPTAPSRWLAGQGGVGGHVLQSRGQPDGAESERKGHEKAPEQRQEHRHDARHGRQQRRGRGTAETDPADEGGHRGQRERAVGVGREEVTHLADHQGEQQHEQTDAADEQEDERDRVHQPPRSVPLHLINRVSGQQHQSTQGVDRATIFRTWSGIVICDRGSTVSCDDIRRSAW